MIDKTVLIPALIGALLLISISSENASGVDFTLVVVTPSQSHETQQGSSGGGGGGGSAENYSNIVVKEKYEQHIFKDKTTSYRFKNASNPIIYINITGNINAGAITTMVEVLRNTSMLVKTPPPGIPYVNVNIWVGTSGFAVPKNIKTALIGFKVYDSWIKSNGLSSSDVKLVKWDGSQWIQLETRELGKTDEFTFYEATTNSFSPFAIVAKVPGTIPAETPEVTQQPITTQTPEVPTEPTAIRAGTYFMIAVGIILIVIIAVEVNMFRKLK